MLDIRLGFDIPTKGKFFTVYWFFLPLVCRVARGAAHIHLFAWGREGADYNSLLGLTALTRLKVGNDRFLSSFYIHLLGFRIGGHRTTGQKETP